MSTIDRKLTPNSVAMNRPQLSLTTILLLTGASPIWAFLVIVVPQSTGWGYNPVRIIIAPLVLIGITATVHKLIGEFRDAWAISAMIADVIALGSLSVAVWYTD